MGRIRWRGADTAIVLNSQSANINCGSRNNACKLHGFL